MESNEELKCLPYVTFSKKNQSATYFLFEIEERREWTAIG